MAASSHEVLSKNLNPGPSEMPKRRGRPPLTPEQREARETIKSEIRKQQIEAKARSLAETHPRTVVVKVPPNGDSQHPHVRVELRKQPEDDSGREEIILKLTEIDGKYWLPVPNPAALEFLMKACDVLNRTRERSRTHQLRYHSALDPLKYTAGGGKAPKPQIKIDPFSARYEYNPALNSRAEPEDTEINSISA